MRQSVLVLAVLLGSTCCVTRVAAATDTAGMVNVQMTVPYAEGATIAGAVRRECQLGEKLSTFIQEYGREKGVAVVLAPEVSASTSGRALVLEIADAQADGNAFLGHHTYTTVKGKLYQDGTQIGNFTGRRNSMGGAFGGFKGNCSVLGRTVRALGEDIAGWLVQPDKDALLGDLN